LLQTSKSQNSDTILKVVNANVGAAATARLQLSADQGLFEFVGNSSAAGGALNATWYGAGAMQNIAANAAGLFVWYTGASPTEKMRLSNAGALTTAQLVTT
jgi:hypothetical protein